MNKRTENNTQNVDVLVHLGAPFMTSGAFSLEIDCNFIYHAIDATLFWGVPIYPHFLSNILTSSH